MVDWSRKSLDEEFKILEQITGDTDILICTNQEFSVASIAEWRNIPAYRVSYIPAIPGDHTPPLIPWQNLPKHVNRLIWKGFGAGFDSMVKKNVNEWRAHHGLPPVKKMTDHMTSVLHTIYAFSKEISPAHPSWDSSVYTYSGYCFEKEEEEPEIPAEVESFLDAGEKPVYLGFGSIHVYDPDEVTRIALEAALLADVRLIIGRGWTGLGKKSVLEEKPGWASPDRVMVVGELSHTRLFPELLGVCHHGGAGTIHRAARAGVPQLVLPIIIDQHFWGNRIYKIGAGPKPIRPKKLTVEALSEIFSNFKKSGNSWKQVSEKLAESINSIDGVSETFGIIQKKTINAAEKTA
jgi:UDP:flavonoid glycosyltransferase YjiC (YdhE family)